MEALRFNRVRQVAKRIANKRRPIYPIIAPIAPNSPALAAPMMMPARSTPSSTASTLDLKSISSRLAASVPVHAPVPGSGMPTKSISATKSPFPAVACSFLPPFSHFSRQKVKNFPMTGLSFPHTRILRAKR